MPKLRPLAAVWHTIVGLAALILGAWIVLPDAVQSWLEPVVRAARAEVDPTLASLSRVPPDEKAPMKPDPKSDAERPPKPKFQPQMEYYDLENESTVAKEQPNYRTGVVVDPDTFVTPVRIIRLFSSAPYPYSGSSSEHFRCVLKKPFFHAFKFWSLCPPRNVVGPQMRVAGKVESDISDFREYWIRSTCMPRQKEITE